MKSPLTEHATRMLGDVPAGSTMLELGTKQLGVWKKYFESIGVLHTSIDLNGLGGALQLDLAGQIDLEPFDYVTNFGTTEHINDQHPVWQNIHNLTKPGGILISTTPYPSGHDWQNHGRWYPTEKWYEGFADLNGYSIEDSYIPDYPGHRFLCYRFRKNAERSRLFAMPSAPMHEQPGRRKMGAYIRVANDLSP